LKRKEGNSARTKRSGASFAPEKGSLGKSQKKKTRLILGGPKEDCDGRSQKSFRYISVTERFPGREEIASAKKGGKNT